MFVKSISALLGSKLLMQSVVWLENFKIAELLDSSNTTKADNVFMN